MNAQLWLGLLAGFVFGFLLQKGRVLRFDKQVQAMLLKDMTIVKFMFSAILVAAIRRTQIQPQTYELGCRLGWWRTVRRWLGVHGFLPGDIGRCSG